MDTILSFVIYVLFIIEIVNNFEGRFKRTFPHVFNVIILQFR